MQTAVPVLQKPFFSSRQRWMALVALSLAFALIQLDASIVTIALGSIRSDLGGDVSAMQWVIDGYTVPLAAFMLTAGSLGDRIGHRKLCLSGLLLFALASVLCALAPEFGWLIAGRVFQGIGAAVLLPSSVALVSQLFPAPAARARALGVWGGVASVGFAAGPLLGGLLLSNFSWQAIFWLNLPVTLLIGLAIRLLAAESPPQSRRLDLAGALLGVLTLATLTAGIIETGHGEPLLYLCLLLVAVVLGFFFFRLERRPGAMLPLNIFSAPSFSWAIGVGFLFNCCLYGTLLSVTLVLQSVLGLTGMASGLAVFPLAVVVCFGAPASGFLAARFGPRVPMMLGFGSGVVGSLTVLFAGLGNSIPLLMVGMGILGLCSFAMPAMTSVALYSAPEEHRGLASGVLNTSRQMGGAIGIAVLGAVLGSHPGSTAVLAPLMAIVAGCFILGLVCTFFATVSRETAQHRVTVR
ncbi:DHA2 family methylenomycin A resistance protein-like MFS transporter [Psychromicrobium silvestre]|uniref:DHA2 family methylenomycin A resistance protein-like MFS transporter n=1 Tax=Psychromicrobium silvestre TaxID=1645614 RepID=A0A7Y9LS91_9MICC|nr:MFS transporter [Psychromicrobium silvestre]NYE94663.1 DHA2 family methylenomycin A resistance protein-like MFS transporter [Psychromicrobium silvestre]